MQLSLPDIEGALQSANGLPDWKTVHAWVDREIPKEKQSAAYWGVTEIWLNNLCQIFGPHYRTVKTKNFRVLSSSQPKMARRRGEFLEFSRERLVRLLGSLAWLDGTGPHVVLIFADPEDYYQYYSNFGKAGERGGSAGAFISGSGYAHIVTHNMETWHLEHTLVHELTHNLVALLPLPLWLNEGLAQLAPETVSLMSNSMQTVVAEQTLIRECWQRHGLEQFWSGESFRQADQRQRRSYQLAEILTRNLLTHPSSKGRFVDFVAAAHRRDGGEGAALDCLGRSLGEAVAEFLGPGEWAPKF